MLASQEQILKTCVTESFSATAYADGMVNGVQMYSIGYGHQIQPNEQSLKRATITKSQAMDILSADISPIENQINNKTAFPLSQSQFDALFDFGYNAGAGSLNNILDTWNATRDPQAVANRMALYDKYHNSAGVLVVNDDLVQRRAEEGLQFLSDALDPMSSVLTGLNSTAMIPVILICVAAVAFLIYG